MSYLGSLGELVFKFSLIKREGYLVRESSHVTDYLLLLVKLVGLVPDKVNIRFKQGTCFLSWSVCVKASVPRDVHFSGEPRWAQSPGC